MPDDAKQTTVGLSKFEKPLIVLDPFACLYHNRVGHPMRPGHGHPVIGQYPSIQRRLFRRPRYTLGASRVVEVRMAVDDAPFRLFCP